MKRCRSVLVGVLLAAAWSSTASAEFWNPLDTVPKPNTIIGFDGSVTMGINPGCTGCHSPTRLEIAKGDIVATLPLFKDYFLFGGYSYSGCGYAKIVNRVMPNPGNPESSYNDTRALINGVGHCGSREWVLPGGASLINCITPTIGCVGDIPPIQALVAGGLPGFNPTTPVATATVCGRPGSPQPTYDLQAALIAKLGSGGMSWPRWAPPVSVSEVTSEFCNPLKNIFQDIRTELQSCLVDPVAFWDMTGLGSWCDPPTVAASACSMMSPFNGTCVCDDSDPLCQGGGVVASACGIPLLYRARQQVAVCESYDSSQANRFGTYYQNQSDNRVNVGGCRENIAMFFTDGYSGHHAGVAAEAAGAAFSYNSVSGQSNMFVFHVSNTFVNNANRMMWHVSQGAHNVAYRATDSDQMQASFSQVLSRIYKGVYTGAALGMDDFQTRAALHIFTVPGYNASGVSEEYIGWPSRIAWHEIGPGGNIVGSPIFETDWSSKATGASCGGGFQINPPSVAVRDKIGPGRSFRNGMARNVGVPANSIDRDGDGAPDAHPALRWGRSYGFASSRPLIVEAPREQPSAENASTYMAHQLSVRSRPRLIYYPSNGYIIGIHGGTYQSGAATHGAQQMSFSYNDSVADAGREVFRYLPPWLNDASAKYRYDLNDLVQQPLMSGELVAREVYARFSGTDQWRTVLVGNQGKEGRGFFVLDVTNPCSSASTIEVAQWQLPAGNYASAEPVIYTLPMSSGLLKRPVVVTTGGLDGSPTMYAFDITNGNQLASIALPGGSSYPSAPIGVDATGEGYHTHYYLVREDGMLVRVEARINGFTNATNVTPVGGGASPMGGGRRYYTSPAVYFGTDGTVNIVYGSGDYKNLTAPSGSNYVFKVRDESVRKDGAAAAPTDKAQVCAPSGGNESGIFALGAGERMISAPMVDKGVVAWVTYISASNGCVAGSGRMYAMNYETCEDAIGGGSRPASVGTGDGLPTTPVLHRRSERLLVHSSAGPTSSQVMPASVTSVGGARPAIKRLYWRLESLDNR